MGTKSEPSTTFLKIPFSTNITTWDGNNSLHLKQTVQMTKIHFSFQAFLAVLLLFIAHNTWSQKHSLDLKGGLSWCDQTCDFLNGTGLMQTQTGFNAPLFLLI